MRDSSSKSEPSLATLKLAKGSTKATTAKAGPGNTKTDPAATPPPKKPAKTLNDSLSISKQWPEPPKKGPGSGIERSRYYAICEDLTEGMTVLEVRRKHGIGQAGAVAIRKHLGEMVSSSDTFAAQGFEAVRDLALKRIYEKLQAGEGKLGELSVVAGVSADKLDSLRGRSQPSQVHQHIHISHAKVSDILSSLPSGDTQSPVHGPKDTEKPAQAEAGNHSSTTPATE